MPGRRRYTTFLVAVTAERGGSPGAIVYAVMTREAAEALAAVQALLEAPAHVAIVGSLSTRTAKAIKLKADEVRLI